MQTIHDIRFFLELCVYYRKFIKDFVSITKSLYEFIHNVENKKFKLIIMNFFARNVFELIKNVIYNDRVLTQSNISLFFVIETNIFDFDWKIVLYQIDQNNKKRFIVFESKTFFFIERNYFTYKRKLLIIKKNFKKWKYYVKNEIIIVIRINYIKLQYLRIIIKFSRKFARWFVEFDKYRFNIRYKSSIEMIMSNILNRKNNFKLRSMQRTLNTMIFDKIVIIYTRDKNLFDKIE